jgi:hypothetical protein
MPYDDAVLQRLLHKGALDGLCPICAAEKETWTLPDNLALLPMSNPEGEDAEEHPIDREGKFALPSAEVLVLACKSCGYVRLFHVDTLLSG